MTSQQSINGFQLQQRIRELKAELEIQHSIAKDSLKAYPGEMKVHPSVVTATIDQLEERLSRLQCAQDLYNLSVLVPTFVDANPRMSLAMCIKLVGPAGRQESFWRRAASGEKKELYREDERSKDTEYKVPTYTREEAIRFHRQFSQKASKLRAMIATLNAVEQPIDSIGLSAEDLVSDDGQ